MNYQIADERKVLPKRLQKLQPVAAKAQEAQAGGIEQAKLKIRELDNLGRKFEAECLDAALNRRKLKTHLESVNG
jgi:hypothetical protein